MAIAAFDDCAGMETVRVQRESAEGTDLIHLGRHMFGGETRLFFSAIRAADDCSRMNICDEKRGAAVETELQLPQNRLLPVNIEFRRPRFCGRDGEAQAQA